MNAGVAAKLSSHTARDNVKHADGLSVQLVVSVVVVKTVLHRMKREDMDGQRMIGKNGAFGQKHHPTPGQVDPHPEVGKRREICPSWFWLNCHALPKTASR